MTLSMADLVLLAIFFGLYFSLGASLYYGYRLILAIREILELRVSVRFLSTKELVEREARLSQEIMP